MLLASGDLSHHILCFFKAAEELAEMNLISGFVGGPERFLFPRGIVGDHMVGSFQDPPRRPVILFQTDDRCIREHVLKSKDITDICSAETVDRLVVVPHHTKIPVFFRQKAYQPELGSIGILIFVHQNVPEPFLIILQYLGMFFEQLHSPHDQIVEIQRVVFCQRSLIFSVCFGSSLFEGISCILRQVIRGQQLILRMRDRRHDRFFLVQLCVQIEAAADFLDHILLVIGIVDGKMIVKSEKIDMAAQDPHTGGMECRDPDALPALSDQPVHPVPHLLRCFVGKGDREDIPGIDLFLIDHISDPVRQDPGLAGARPGQDQKRAFRTEYRLLLRRIQCVIYRIHGILLCLLHYTGRPEFSQGTFRQLYKKRFTFHPGNLII